MSAFRQVKTLGSIVITVSAAALATYTPCIGNAAFLPVYGGPTYSPVTGGYLAENLPILGFLYSGHVNDAGMAAATVYEYSSSGLLGSRAVRWSASSPAVELGGDGGSLSSLRAERINAVGAVVGSVLVPNERDPNGEWRQYRPARWAASGTAATVLEHPYVEDGSFYSPHNTFVQDVNDSGDGVGTVWRSSLDQNGIPIDEGTRPGRWNAAGTSLTELGGLGPGEAYGHARAINAAGVAVGNVQKYDAAGDYGSRAVRWDPSSVAATELGHLGALANDPSYAPDGYTEGVAVAINGAGTVVGFTHVYDQSGKLLMQLAPVRWDASGTPTQLGTLGGGDHNINRSNAALNDAGTVVGWDSKRSADGTFSLGTRAIRWDASSAAAVELGTLSTHPRGITQSEAWAVNAAGTAVGFAHTYSATGTFLGERAVYWGADTLAINLNTLIDPSNGWVLTRALEISNTGWIVGEGMFDPDGFGGQAAYSRHFLMHVPATAVPEPATWLLLVGGTLLARLRPSHVENNGRRGSPSKLLTGISRGAHCARPRAMTFDYIANRIRSKQRRHNKTRDAQSCLHPSSDHPGSAVSSR